MYKTINSYSIATYDVGIKGGKTISNRNVATSRLAQFMGIGHMVAQSETAVVEIDGEKVYGNLMAEAKGVTSRSKQANRVMYSTNAMSQMITMQLFDFICGQLDRNDNNYMLNIEEENGQKNISSIQMIDNDFCMGSFATRKSLDRRVINLPKYDFDLGIPDALVCTKEIRTVISYGQATKRQNMGRNLPFPRTSAESEAGRKACRGDDRISRE